MVQIVYESDLKGKKEMIIGAKGLGKGVVGCNVSDA